MSKIGGILKIIGIVAEVLPKVVGIFSKQKNLDLNSRAGETMSEDDAEYDAGDNAEGVAEGGAGENAGKRTKSRKSVKK